jgi:tetratricopeptide (TPR) repeat protein
MKTTSALELKNKGNEFFKSGDYENALQCYGKAVDIDPEYRDAWNNIYITLLKLERIDDARKCKDILDKLTFEPDGAPGKHVKVMRSSFGRKVFIAVIILMLLVSITISTLAILGWINTPGTPAGSPEHMITGIISNVTGLTFGTSTTKEVIAANNSANKYVSKNVIITAVRSGDAIILKNYGGADTNSLVALNVVVDTTGQGTQLGTGIGSSVTVYGKPGQKTQIVVTGKFTDGTEQVVFDSTL